MTTQDLKAAALAASQPDKRRKRVDWNGCCPDEDRPCEATELCWPANHCFRQDGRIIASEKAKSLKLFQGAANPATILALLERLQVAEDAAKLMQELMSCTRSDPARGRSNAGKWTPVNVRTELIEHAAIAARRLT